MTNEKWTELTRDTRLERCTHRECTNQPIWQLERDGIKSLYCTKHKEQIEKASTIFDTLRRVIGPHSDVDIPALADKLTAAARQHRDFVLHEDDGSNESNAKTTELHAFLYTICNPDTNHDFDGTNEGLTIYLSAAPGDTIRIFEDGSVLIIQKPE
jgi:hypothetical protein